MAFSFSKIDLNQESQLRERIFFVLILILMIVIFFRLFWTPKVSQIKQEKVQMDAFAAQEKTLRKFLDMKAPENKVSTDKGKETLASKQAGMLLGEEGNVESEVAELLRTIGDGDLLKDVRILSISTMLRVDKDGFGMVPVDVVLKGRFSSIGQYFQNVGKLNNPLNIEGIELNSSKTEKGVLEARIRINLFVKI